MSNKDSILIEFIIQEKFDTIFYLPCSTMINIISYFKNNSLVNLIPINKEDEGIGLITGMHLTNSKPLLLIQDSGLGNSYNAIVSLLMFYKVAVMIIVTIRGYIGEISSPNTIWSEKTTSIHNAIGIKEYVLNNSLELPHWNGTLMGAVKDMAINNRPVIVKVDLSNGGPINV